MKTIAIDCRFAATNSGLGRYTRELVRRMTSAQDLKCILLTQSMQESWIPQGAAVIEAPIPHYSLAEQTRLPQIIRSTNADVLFSPHFNVPYRCPIPFVITVHDLILHHYPNRASALKQFFYRRLMKRAVSQASAIVTVSNFVAKELSIAYGSSIQSRLRVIPEGVDESYGPIDANRIREVMSIHDIQTPYFLYVGNAKQHKNVQVLIDAFSLLPASDVQLILVTGGAESAALRLAERVRILSNVAEEHLPAFYAGANLFVTASLYEGFCLPVAEALACGCPVIASNRSAIPEVAHGRAMLVEPTIQGVLEAFRMPPTDRTPYRVGSWDEAAQATAALLQQL